MKKIEQIAVNEKVKIAYREAMAEIKCLVDIGPAKRLRSCNAYVYETNKYYYLRSYDTIVAVIDKETDTLYDFLRIAYGYTNTSAQHIAKFSHDYGAGKWGCKNSERWYAIG